MDRSQGRIARPGAEIAPTVETFSGNRGLQLEEPLIFEQDMPGRQGAGSRRQQRPRPPSIVQRLARNIRACGERRQRRHHQTDRQPNPFHRTLRLRNPAIG